jgi:hypothetical protein
MGDVRSPHIHTALAGRTRRPPKAFAFATEAARRAPISITSTRAPPYGSADLRRGATHRCEHREAAGLAEAAAVLNGRGPAGGELGQFSRRFYPNDINLIVYFD